MPPTTPMVMPIVQSAPSAQPMNITVKVNQHLDAEGWGSDFYKSKQPAPEVAVVSAPAPAPGSESSYMPMTSMTTPDPSAPSGMVPFAPSPAIAQVPGMGNASLPDASVQNESPPENATSGPELPPMPPIHGDLSPHLTA
jgi:hypothetical protein